MKFLSSFLDRLTRAKEKAEDLVVLPSPVEIGYFNGLCPNCKNHIGTYVWREYVRPKVRKKEIKAVHCPCCGAEIYERVRGKLEIGRL